jgi:hypothetical protein
MAVYGLRPNPPYVAIAGVPRRSPHITYEITQARALTEVKDRRAQSREGSW